MRATITPTTVPVLDPASPTLAADVAAVLVFHEFAAYPPDPHTILAITESGAGGWLHVVCAAAIDPPLPDGTTVTLSGNIYAGMSGPLAGESVGAEFEVQIDFAGDVIGGTWALA